VVSETLANTLWFNQFGFDYFERFDELFFVEKKLFGKIVEENYTRHKTGESKRHMHSTNEIRNWVFLRFRFCEASLFKIRVSYMVLS